MSKRPWMPLYCADYLADTRHLTTIEHGAYMLLILHYWRTGKLPVEDDRLSRIAGLTPEEWAHSRHVISDFFDKDWRHKRVEHELAEAERISQAGRAGGIASGKSRKNRTTVERPLNAQSTKPQLSQSQSHSSEASASGGEPPEAKLFRLGVQILDTLGVNEKRSRPMIGRWRRDTGDDCARVLAAIYRAQELAVVDPAAYITAMLKPQGRQNGPTENLVTAAKRLAEQGVSFGPRPGSVCSEAVSNVVRLLPEDGGE